MSAAAAAFLRQYLSIKDGQIDFAEFLNILYNHIKTEKANEEVLNAFRAYDYKKTGFITTKELRSILTKTGERLANKDGKKIINFYYDN